MAARPDPGSGSDVDAVDLQPLHGHALGDTQLDPDDAATVFEGNSQLTVHHNPHLDAYLAVYVDGMSDDLVLRTAPAPEGPWSAPEYAFTAEPDLGEGFVYCGLGHEELAGEGGRLEYVSYYRGTGDWTGEIRLVEVEVGVP